MAREHSIQRLGSQERKVFPPQANLLKYREEGADQQIVYRLSEQDHFVPPYACSQLGQKE